MGISGRWRCLHFTGAPLAGAPALVDNGAFYRLAMPSMTDQSLAELQRALLAFRDARDWKQFHSLRNLIVSLNLEAAELLELTQWQQDHEVTDIARDPLRRQALLDECGDVLLYLLLIADAAGFDLVAAGVDKLRRNGEKYPVEKARGSRRKYSRLDD